MLLRSVILDNNIPNINYSILQTIIYTFFDKLNTGSCLNRYYKMRPLFFKIAPGHFRAENGKCLDRVLHDLSLTCNLFRQSFVLMFINVKCLLWCDPDDYFRLLSVLPVKIFKIAMTFYRFLVYMHPIFCRYFLFLMIGNMLWKQIHNQKKLIPLSFCTSTDFSVYTKLVPVQWFKAHLLSFCEQSICKQYELHGVKYQEILFTYHEII